jgi:UDP-glucose 4-epimerase
MVSAHAPDRFVRPGWWSVRARPLFSMKILVTGGSGYIGSVTVEFLRTRGDDVVVLDNLSRGHRDAVDPRVPFVLGDTGNASLIAKIVDEHSIDSCIHFAGYAYVAESVENPSLYLENNVVQGISLIESLARAGVRYFVFSSSCTIYGAPWQLPVAENHVLQPCNPYGWTKLFLEKILQMYDGAHGMRHVSLRYFNAAGATRAHGERHDPEPHLIPTVLRAAAGEILCLPIYGSSHSTKDGTAVRDYVHVSDLASAHCLALEYLRSGGASDCLNLGSGRGHSVLEVIETAKIVTGRDIAVQLENPRPGDAPMLVAQCEKAKSLLGWTPQASSLEEMIRTAWEWKLSRAATAPQASGQRG